MLYYNRIYYVRDGLLKMNLFDLRLIQDQSIYNMDNLDKADFHALTKYAIFHNTDNMDIYHLLLIIFAHIKCKDLIRTLYENYIKDLDVQGRSMIFNESIDTVCKYSIRKEDIIARIFVVHVLSIVNIYTMFFHRSLSGGINLHIIYQTQYIVDHVLLRWFVYLMMLIL